MPSRDLSFPVFDADNHFYEPREALTKFLPDEHKHAFMYAEAPRILFPFARRVIGDAVRDAGFSPLMLDPIDFNGIYLQQLAQRVEPGQPGAPAGEA